MRRSGSTVSSFNYKSIPFPDESTKIVVNKILNEITENIQAHNLVEYYIKVNKFGLDQSNNIRHVKSSDGPIRINREREDKIRCALYMVIDQLVSQGHLSSVKSYKLNTPQMREHIGQIYDRLNKEQKETEEATTRKELAEFLRNDSSNTSVGADSLTDRTGIVPKATQKKRKSILKKAGSNKSHHKNFAARNKVTTSIQTANAKHGRKEVEFVLAFKNPSAFSESESNLTPVSKPASNSINFDKSDLSLRTLGLLPSTSRASARFRKDGFAPELPSAAVSFTSRQMLEELNLIEPTRLSKFPIYLAPKSTLDSTSSQAQRFCKRIDLLGFKRDQITLKTIGHQLIVIGTKPDGSFHKGRKLIEIVQIPKDIRMKNIGIDKHEAGHLWVKELEPVGIANKKMHESFSKQVRVAGAGAASTVTPTANGGETPMKNDLKNSQSNLLI